MQEDDKKELQEETEQKEEHLDGTQKAQHIQKSRHACVHQAIQHKKGKKQKKNECKKGEKGQKKVKESQASETSNHDNVLFLFERERCTFCVSLRNKRKTSCDTHLRSCPFNLTNTRNNRYQQYQKEE